MSSTSSESGSATNTSTSSSSSSSEVETKPKKTESKGTPRKEAPSKSVKSSKKSEASTPRKSVKHDDDPRKSKRESDDPRKSVKSEKSENGQKSVKSSKKSEASTPRKSVKHDEDPRKSVKSSKKENDDPRKSVKSSKKESDDPRKSVKSSQKDENVRKSVKSEKSQKSQTSKTDSKHSSKKHQKKEETSSSESSSSSESHSKSSSSSSSSSVEIAKKRAKVKTIPVEGEEEEKDTTPFVDIPESVSIKPLEEEIVPFEGMKQEDFDRLKKYNESYEDGRNLLHYFIYNISSYDTLAYFQEKAKQPRISYKKFSMEIKALSRSFIEMNKPKRAVLIMTKNTWKSYAVGLGALLAGMIQVYVNPNLPLSDLVECVKQSGAVQVVTDIDHRDLAMELMNITKITGLLIDGFSHDDNMVNYDEFKNRGQRMNDSIIQRMMKEASPTDIAEIVFVQGVNGIHGIVWTHGNIISQMNAFKNSFGMSKDHRIIMSHHHSFYLERIFTLYLPLMFGYLIYIPFENVYCEGLKHFIQTARNFKPTIIYGVPRFYEKLLERAKEAVGDGKLVKQARYLGIQGYKNQEAGVSKPTGFGTSRSKVFNPMKEKLGLMEVQYMLCTDILSPSIMEEIMGKGLEVFCGLSLPETTGFCFINRERNLQVETVGRPLKGVSIVFRGKSNLLVNGAIVAGGYTDQMFGPQGFDTRMHAKILKYKDSGVAFVKITETSHDLVRTSNGEQISYKRVEDALKKISVVKNVIVVGEGKPFLSCIMTVCYGEAKKRLLEKCPNKKDLIRDNYFGSYVRQRIDRINKNFPNGVQVKRFALLLEGSDESKWIKPEMNYEERKAICEHFEKAIEMLYKRGSAEVTGLDREKEMAIQKERMKEEKERLKEEKQQRRMNKMKGQNI